MPGEAGAFDARREIPHAGEDRQAAEMIGRRFRVQLSRDHAMKLIEERLGVLLGLAFDALRHHTRRRFRDRASLSFKADVFDDLVFEQHIDAQLIAAQRVIAFGCTVSTIELMKISRLLVVVEDDLLVQLAQF